MCACACVRACARVRVSVCACACAAGEGGGGTSFARVSSCICTPWFRQARLPSLSCGSRSPHLSRLMLSGPQQHQVLRNGETNHHVHSNFFFARGRPPQRFHFRIQSQRCGPRDQLTQQSASLPESCSRSNSRPLTKESSSDINHRLVTKKCTTTFTLVHSGAPKRNVTSCTPDATLPETLGESEGGFAHVKLP